MEGINKKIQELTKSYDSESKDYFLNLGKQAEKNQKMLELVDALFRMGIKDLIENKINQINTLLINDPSLDTDTQKRMALKHEKNVHLFYLKIFSPETYQKSIDSILSTIDKHINN